MLGNGSEFSSFSVDDLQRAREFYGGTLGLEVSESPMGLELRLASGSNVFVYPKSDHAPASFTVLNFPVDDVVSTVDRLNADGVAFERYDSGEIRTDERGIAADEGMKIAWFRDPAGNFLSVIENGRDSPTRGRKTDALIAEITTEAVTTRRVLERVPEDRLTWKPHPKSMSLGQLAFHVAGLVGGVATLLDDLEAGIPDFPLHEASSRHEILTALDESVRTGTELLSGWGDEGLSQIWMMKAGGETLLELPRIAMVRSVMMNHWYHHRGQLLVYLRLLDVPVPPVYGPTADESPFDETTTSAAENQR